MRPALQGLVRGLAPTATAYSLASWTTTLWVLPMGRPEKRPARSLSLLKVTGLAWPMSRS